MDNAFKFVRDNGTFYKLIQESFMKMSMVTRQSSKPAKWPLDHSRSPDSPMSGVAMPFPPLSREDPSQSPSMPPTGPNTQAESSATVPPDSTMVSLWSELAKAAGGSRTPGQLVGEKKDSSDSPPETPAVFATLPHIPTNDLSKPSQHRHFMIFLSVGLSNKNIANRSKHIKLILMSLERLKVKKSKYSDTYSKNPILNSLIKQKL